MRCIVNARSDGIMITAARVLNVGYTRQYMLTLVATEPSQLCANAAQLRPSLASSWTPLDLSFVGLLHALPRAALFGRHRVARLAAPCPRWFTALVEFASSSPPLALWWLPSGVCDQGHRTCFQCYVGTVKTRCRSRIRRLQQSEPDPLALLGPRAQVQQKRQAQLWQAQSHQTHNAFTASSNSARYRGCKCVPS